MASVAQGIEVVGVSAKPNEVGPTATQSPAPRFVVVLTQKQNVGLRPNHLHPFLHDFFSVHYHLIFHNVKRVFEAFEKPRIFCENKA